MLFKKEKTPFNENFNLSKKKKRLHLKTLKIMKVIFINSNERNFNMHREK